MTIRGLLVTGLVLALGLRLWAAEPVSVTKDADDKFDAYLRRIESTYTNDLQAADPARQQELRLKRNRDILDLARKYDAMLAEKQAKLTAAGNSAGALAVKEARERAMLNSAVTAAEFEMAVSEPSAAENDTPATEVSEEPAPVDAEASVTAAAANPEEERTAGVLVFGPGQRPPAQDATAVKKLIMARSENAPLGSPVVVASTYTIESDTKREDISHYRREDVLERWQLRLQLRTAPAAGSINGVLVVVQNFIKSAQAQGRVEPETYTVCRVPLGSLAPDPTTIDFPPVETHRIRQRLGQGATWTDEGKEFYGIIVSVFDANRTLIYQCSSTRGLNSLAGTGVPELGMRERVEEARLEMEHAQAALNSARVLFFSDQHNATNRDAFVDATGAFEASQRKYVGLKTIFDAQQVPVR